MSIPGVQRIVGIHAAPRSGSTWLGQLFNASEHVAYRYQPLFSYAFKGRLHAASNADEISGFFSDLLVTTDDFVLQRGNASLAGYELSFRKANITHLVYKEVRHHDVISRLLAAEPSYSAIGLVRDPRAVIYSWSKAPREFDGSWDLSKEWRNAARKNSDLAENWYGFERWKKLTLLFHKLRDEYPGRFHIIRYEELLAMPEIALASLYGSLGLPWTPQVQAFLKESQSRDDGSAYGVFRNSGEIQNNWRGELPSEITEAIHDELEDSRLSRYLSMMK
jgi:hypothetical protein